MTNTPLVRQKSDVEVVSRLSPLQEGILFHTLQAGDKDPYLYQYGFDITGVFDQEKFSQAWLHVAKHYQVLRSEYRWEETDKPLQIVFKTPLVDLEVIDIAAQVKTVSRDSVASTTQSIIQETLARVRQQNHPLKNSSYVNLRVFLLGDNRWSFYYSFHHIAVDGWSLSKILGDLLSAYQALLKNESPASISTLPYTTYVKWITEKDVGPMEAYWAKLLQGFQEKTPLPLARSIRDDNRYADRTLVFTADETNSIKLAARNVGVTVNTMVQFAWGLLLSRYSGVEDIVFGVTTSGRAVPLAGVESVVGLCINTLPSRMKLDPQMKTHDWLQEVQQQSVNSREFEYSPLAALAKYADLEEGQGLFDSILVFENYPVDEALKQAPQGLVITQAEKGGEQVAGDVHYHSGRNNYPISLIAVLGSQLQLVLSYHCKFYAHETVAEIAAQLKHILFDLVDGDKQFVGDIALDADSLSASDNTIALFQVSEADNVLQQFLNITRQYYGEGKGHRIAVSDAQHELSWRELDQRSSQLANHLHALGVGPEVAIGVFMGRRCELLVSLLGIMKAGGIYLPMDIAWPADRIQHIVKDANIAVILHHKDDDKKITNEQLSELNCKLLFCNAEEISTTERQSPDVYVQPQQAAYIIYTSGSTGVPKGVVITHGALIHYTQNVLQKLSCAPKASMGMVSTVAADLGHTMLFGALCSGRTLHLIPESASFDPDNFAQYMRRKNIGILKIVPGHLKGLLQAQQAQDVLPEHILVLGGESCDGALVQRIHNLKPGCKIINHYGPTETTVGSLVFAVPAGAVNDSDTGNVPIGQALPHGYARVVDTNLHPQPHNVRGELLIGGKSLARGYLNKPSLTAERFIPDSEGKNGERLYRTGDGVFCNTSGQIEYIGRLDNQVKIRGYRVEPDEIAQTLKNLDGVADACVITRRSDADNHLQLVAYLVANLNQPFTMDVIKAQIAERLPDYMVPASILQINTIPRTANGKIDKKNLPDVQVQKSGYVSPANETEEKLASVWADVLKIERVGVTDNFFELGGDSILSLQIIARARKQGIKITPKQLFDKQTIQELAKVATAVEARKSTVAPVNNKFPLTPIQHSFFERDIPQRNHFNQSVLLHSNTVLSPIWIEKALQQLVTQHDSLRVVYGNEQGKWQAHIQSAQMREMHWKEQAILWQRSIADTNNLQQLCNEAQASLDISRGDLIRALLVTLPDNSQRLLIAIHHLAIDGISWRILLDDFQTLYQQYTAGNSAVTTMVSTPFAEWANKLADYVRGGALEREKNYWLEQLSGINHSLPSKNPTGSLRATYLGSAATLVDETTTQQLLTSHAAYRTQINDLLLTALARVMVHWIQQESVLIQLEGHGREDIIDGLDLSRTLGWFSTLFPVKLALGSDKGEGIGESIKAVKEQLRKVPEKGIGYGLLRYLGTADIQEQLKSLPQARITFNYLGQFDQQFDRDVLLVPAQEDGGDSIDRDAALGNWITINGQVYQGVLQFNWSFSTELFAPDVINNLAAEFGRELELVAAHCAHQQETCFTPSDFPLVSLTQQQLDSISKTYQHIDNIYPLSPVQQGMLFQSLYDPNGLAYVNQLEVDIHHLDVERFCAAWRQTVAMHDVLRAAFLSDYQDGTEALQIIQRTVELPIAIMDWREQSAIHIALEDYVRNDRGRGFDVTQAPLMRLSLVRISDSVWRFIYTNHHILTDGWSTSRLFGEILQRYAGEVPAQPVGSYRDYLAWLKDRNQVQSEVFWKEQLASLDEPTLLGNVLVRPHSDEKQSSEHGQYVQAFSLQDTRDLTTFAKANKVTVNTVLQAAWLLLLQRYTGQEVVAFGATVAGRPTEINGIEQQLGLFINTLPVVAQPKATQSVNDWLQQVQQQNLQLRDYEHTPLYEIQRWAGQGGNTLFDSILVFENYPVSEALQEAPGGLSFSGLHNHEQTHYGLTLVVTLGEQLSITCRYDRTQFADAGIRALAEHWQSLLAGFMANSQQLLGNIPLLGQQEQQQILKDWNITDVNYGESECIHSLIETQAKNAGDAIAVTGPGLTQKTSDNAQPISLSYFDLNTKANQLAHYLRVKGVGPDVLVGIAVERSVEMVIGLLAILKAGGAYVPLDPEYPSERIAYMIENSQLNLLLTQSSLQHQLPIPTQVETVLLDDVLSDSTESIWNNYSTHNLTNCILPSNLAYVIYTSGSTGKPKGTLLPHRNVSRLFDATQHWFSFGSKDVWTMFHSYAFDFSVWEIFGALVYGGRLVIVPFMTSRSPDAFWKMLEEEKVTVLNQTPSAFRQLMQVAINEGQTGNEGQATASALRYVIFGGEALELESLQPWFNRFGDSAPQLINMYGITETTVHVTYRPLTRDDKSGSPIGQVIPDLSWYVLDGELNPVMRGGQGELHVGQAGLARGYLKRGGLTAERFIPDPFAREPGGRLYRTGDLARYRADGVIEYAGRIDHQVKIRGFRIELGEIETQLHLLDSIRDVAVLAVDIHNSKQLVAYVVPQDASLVTTEHTEARQQWRADIKTALQAVLPDYMVPAHIVLLEQLPLTPNGKLDRKALPAVDVGDAQQTYVAPQSEIEQQLAAIWQSVLGIEQIGLNDNFFELGGHSLLATQVISRIRQQLSLELPLRSLFETSDLRSFATRVAGMSDGHSEQRLPVSNPVVPVSRDHALPLSFGQQRQWLLWKIEPDSAAYHIHTALRLKGDLDITVLERSFAVLIDRHEVLRTCITEDDSGHPVQQIDARSSFALQRESLPANVSDDVLQTRLASFGQTPFAMQTGPLLRALLLELSGANDPVSTGNYILALTQHHIISDAWSIGRMVEELVTIYAALVEGKTPDLPVLPVQYADYAVWQRERLSGAEGEKQLAYWKQQLGDEHPVLELPLDHPRPLQPSYRGARHSWQVDQETLAGIDRQARRHGVTRYMWLLAAFQTLLHRYSGQSDIRVGTPIANRTRLETEHLLGFFVNTQVLRAQFAPDTRFEELLEQVRQASLEAQAHQDLPFEQLVEVLQPERSLSHSPLFQVMFNYQSESKGISVQQLPGLVAEGVRRDTDTAQFDLTLDVNDTGHQLLCSFNYATDLFDSITITRMANHWLKLISSLLEQPVQRLAQLPLLSAVEQQQILKDWNSTSADYGESECIHSLIEAQAKTIGDAIAVTGPGLTQETSDTTQQISLSYSDLNIKANQLAHYLRAQGVGPDVLVGIAVERSVEMVIGLLAILKAGGAYVPLDPEYPADRLAYMIENSNINLLLTQSSLQHQLPIPPQVETVLLDELLSTSNQSLWKNYPTINPANLTLPSNLAYVIYTSGSTGKPKGVAIAHRNTFELIRWSQSVYKCDDLQGVLAATSICFDLSVWELFVTLGSGGHVIVAENALALASHPARDQVRLVNTVPSAIAALAQANAIPASVKIVNLAGEALSQAVVDQLYGMGVDVVYDLYGPSEDTTYSTYTRRIAGGRPDIGRPISNTQTYILDNSLQPVPVGVVGELYIAGTGLAQGYLNKPQLTADKFLPNPFSTTGERFYRTGDLARYRADGVIEYAGRIDYQVKIRGFRIELGEIDAQLHALEAVRDVAVIALDTANGKQLVAYLVPQDASLVATEHTEARQQWRADIKTALQAVLPDYMVPAHLVLLEQLPLTPNGKLDRRALPAVDVGDAQQTYVAPQSEIEQQLAAIWQSVLGIEQIGLNDNFFELGGHSLLATQVISRIRQQLSLELPLRSLFETSDLRSFATRVAGMSDGHSEQSLQVSNPVVPVSRDHALPLSFGQQRQWLLWKIEPDSAAYHIHTALRLKGDLDITVLERSFAVLIDRHEVLRTCITEDDSGHPVQQIDARSSFALQRESLPANVSDDVLQTRLASFGQTPFAMQTGPLLRALLLELSGANDPVSTGNYILALTQHHIISDAWSIGRMVEELVTIYAALVEGKTPDLPVLPVQYADYAVWQRERLSGAEGEKQLAYWKQQLGDEHPVLELPLDHPRPLQPSYRGARHSWQVDQETLAGIDRQARRHGVTRYMWLLAAFQTLLHRYSGQSDIRVGTPIANRTRLETEHLLGFFVNTQVLRAQFAPDTRFEELLEQVRQASLEAQAHQDLPFEQLVEVLQPERSLSHSPLFQVMFNYQSESKGISVQQLPGLVAEGVRRDTDTAQFDLTLDVNDTGHQLLCSFNYATDLFDSITITRMANHWHTLIDHLLAQPRQLITHLSLLDVTELTQVTRTWNPVSLEQQHYLSVVAAFEAQVQQHPHKLAISLEEQALTYWDLNNRANQLAYQLRARGVGADVLVGIAVERSVEMVIGLLAILKAGGAYVPLDPEYPSERLTYMINNSGIRLLLTQNGLEQLIVPATVNALLIDTVNTPAREAHNPGVDIPPGSAAYLIYTSGTTGQPKGVCIEHAALAKHIAVFTRRIALTEDDCVLQFATFSFDTFVEQLFPALCAGASIIMRGRDIWDNEQFHRKLLQHQISVADLPATYWYQLGQYFAQLSAVHNGKCDYGRLRQIIVGGEAMPPEGLHHWKKAGLTQVSLLNAYGPTEATITATVLECNPYLVSDETIPMVMSIGQALENRSIYILDNNLSPVPIRITGELVIGGDLLARGYYGNPALTAERFIPDPFATDCSGGGRLYRTGDLGRYRHDGVIEYAGRMDQQVKIRGFRIELGEIESTLNSLAMVSESVVVTAADEKHLIAYVIPIDTSLLNSNNKTRNQWRDDLKNTLQQSLPEYMVPTYVILLEKIPVTPNGKLDRKALPAVDLEEFRKAYQEPVTFLEKELVEIWQAVLGIERVGLNDNFFELGGDSIICIQIVSKARQRGIYFTPKDLLQFQTVQAVARIAEKKTDVSVIDQQPMAGVLLPTPIILEFMHTEIPNPHHWNQSVLLKPSMELNVGWLESALNYIVEHHDILRLQVNESGDNEYQFEYRSLEEQKRLNDINPLLWQYELHDANELADYCNRAHSSLNFNNGQLLRALLVTMPDNSQRFLLTIHHLVVDGVSWRILLEDLQSAYKNLSEGIAITIGSKTTSFGLWSEALNDYAKRAEVVAELDYWREQLTGVDVALPTRKIVNSTAHEKASVGSQKVITTVLDKEVTQQLLQVAPSAYRTQINDLLLTALAGVIARWTGNESVLIKLEAHGREDLFPHVDITRTLGWFTSIFPVRLNICSNLADTIKSIKETLRKIPNKGIGYGVLRYLGEQSIQAELSRLPQPNIAFNYLGQFDQSFDEKSIFVPATEHNGNAVDVNAPLDSDLEINGRIFDGELKLSWTYSSHTFDQSVVEALAEQLGEELGLIVSHCSDSKNKSFTPSDFPLANLSQQHLENLPIAVDDVADIYPLSPMQEGLLLHTLLEPTSGIYLMQESYRINSAINPDYFEQAWRSVIARHEVLRSVFWWNNGGEMLQVIKKSAGDFFIFIDWSEVEETQHQQLIDDFLAKERETSFDLRYEPPFRLRLIQLKDNAFYFVMTFHHILMDAWCNSLLIRDFFDYYQHLDGGLPPNKIPAPAFRDFIAWLKSQDDKKSIEFWRKQLDGFEQAVSLPFDRQISSQNNNYSVVDEIVVALDTQYAHQLRDLSTHNNLTINTFVQAAWALVLHNFSGARDLVYGVTVAGRPVELPHLQEAIGLFINTIPMRVILPEAGKPYAVKNWLQDIFNYNLQLREHEHIPLVNIQNLSMVDNGSPLFHSLFVYENAPFDAGTRQTASEMHIQSLSLRTHTNYPITVIIYPGSSIKMGISFDHRYFEVNTIHLLLDSLRQAIVGLIENFAGDFSSLGLVDTQTENALLDTFNRTARAYPLYTGYASLFEEQVKRHPQKIAASCLGETWTYKELNEKANILAHTLINTGVLPDSPVALLAQRGLPLLGMINGVFKSAAGYVPLDPNNPVNRLVLILKSCAPKVLVTTDESLSIAEDIIQQLPERQRPLIVNWDSILQQNIYRTNPQLTVTGQHLAYVIYTSGSTGTPKGVMVEQAGMLNNQLSKIPYLDLNGADVIAQTAAQGFDISVWQFLTAALCGARVDIVPQHIAQDPAALLIHVEQNGITVLESVPALISGMLVTDAIELTSLRRLLPTGEAMPPELARRWIERYPTIALLNAYGPAECSDDVALHPVSLADTAGAYLPVGEPTDNNRLFVLNENASLLPLRATGELCIAGTGVSRGYLGDPARTAQVFIPNEFATTPGERLYRSGDLVRRRIGDGVIEYVGRADFQVKIRGYRIELGEIEAQLHAHHWVQNAVVVATENKTGKQLVGYLLLNDSSWINESAQLQRQRVDELKNWLLSALPEYMVPAHLVLLEKLPLSANGKLDRKALPKVDIELLQDAYVAPRNNTEEILVQIWAGLLDVTRVGVFDNFFSLGGHSLLMVRLLAQVKQHFNVEFSLHEFYQANTLATMAELILDQQQSNPDESLDVMFDLLDEIEDGEYEHAGEV